MSNADSRGKFVWHELLSSDTAGAGAFYPKVVSWKAQPWDKDPSYTLWMGKGGPIGGLTALDETQGSARWLAYVAVEDVHATVAQAKSMGAKVIKDVTDMPGTGTYAILTDPQGAEFAVFKSANPSESSGSPNVGEFSWHELGTSDPEGAVSFYSKLFGWGVGPKHDMGPEFGTYHLMLHSGQQFVGIFKAGENMPTGWMCYVRVDDAGKSANAAKSAGGRVINGPMEVPGGSWIAQILDPAGVIFAVHEVKEMAQPAAAEPAAKPAAKPKEPKAAKPAKAEAAKAAAPATDSSAKSSTDSAAKPADDAKPAAKPAASKPAAKPADTAKPAAKPAEAAKPPAPAPAKQAAASSAPAAKKSAPAAAAKKPAPASKPAAKKAAAKKSPAKSASKKAPAKKGPAKKAAKKVAKKAAKKVAKKAAKKAPAKKAKKKAKAKK